MYSKVGGYGGILPRENLNFQNLRNAFFFWPFGTVVCFITYVVTTKLKGHFFGDPPFSHHIFSAGPPFEAIFFYMAPPQIPRAPLPHKKMNGPYYVASGGKILICFKSAI